MNYLLKYIRYYILTGSCIAAALIYMVNVKNITPLTSAYAETGQAFALIAFGFLYLALLCTPLYAAMPTLPFRAIYIRARRALGVSAFLFAALHATIEFFGLLGGFTGFGFLTGQYLAAVLLGLTALTILFIMTLTSTDYAVRKLGKLWKKIHRFVYLAGMVIIVHVLFIGSDFMNLASIEATVFFTFVGFLLILEAFRLSGYLNRKFPTVSKTIFSSILVALILGLIFYIFFKGGLFGVHSSHGA